MNYDALGRRTREITLDTGTKSFEFDAVTGLLTRETNGDGEAVEYFYEPRSSRMTALSRGERQVRLRYGKGAADQANNTVGRVKDALYDVIPPPIDTYQQAHTRCINDMLCSSEVYAYDALGQQVGRTRELPGGETLSTQSTLDSFGRVQQLRHVRGGDTVDVNYRYNSAGRVTHAEGKAHGMARTWVDSVQYDHQGRTVGIQFGNGVRKEYSYDAQTDWMTRVVACAPAFGGPSCSGSSKVYQDLVLTHSPAGDILTSSTRATVSGLLTGQVWGFGYDKRHRLVSSFLTGVNPSGGALTWQEGWTFDALHRLTSRTTTKSTETGVETRAEQFAFSGLHQPRCATPGTCEEERTKYDAAGRVTHLTSPTGDARTLQWTHDSMLRSVTEVGGGVLQENGYALAGERTTRSGAYGTYRYLGPTVTDGPTGLNAHVWVNGSRVATAFPAGTYFYVSDQLGSTTMVLDSGGDVVTQVVQSPYGREIYQSAAPDWAPPAQQFLLTGKERDPETGFHAYGWRDWSSAGNHWLAPEPIWEDALGQDSVGLAQYHGVSWQPTRRGDPNGRCPGCFVGGAVGGAGYVVDWALDDSKTWSTADFGEAALSGATVGLMLNAPVLAPFVLGASAIDGYRNFQDHQSRLRAKAEAGNAPSDKDAANAAVKVIIVAATAAKASQTAPLTQRQSAAVQKIRNIIRQHLTPSDVAGAVGDQAGSPVPKTRQPGQYWDHAKEVEESLGGLRKHAKTLEGLEHPDAIAARTEALDAIRATESAIAGSGL